MAGMRVGALDDGMLPVNTAGNPGGGLQWPSGGDVGVATGGLVEKVLMIVGLRTTASGLVVLLMMEFGTAVAAWAGLRLRY